MTTGTNTALVNAVLSGVADARQTYATWTRDGGYFAWAPEYLLTVSVAQSIWEWCAPLTVWPEFRLTDALREACPGNQRRPARTATGRRADLLVYRGTPQPHAIVEIKRNVDGWGKIAADVERLRTTLAAPGASFQLGMVAFSSTLIGGNQAKGGAILQDRLARLADCVDHIRLPGWHCRLTTRAIHFDGHEHWSAAAVVLEKSTVRPSRRGCDPACTGSPAQVLSAS